MFLRDIKTSLFQSIYTGDIEMAKAILRCGFDIESRDQYDRTPLMISHMLQRKEFIYLFLLYGADIYASDYNNNGIFYYSKLLSVD